MEKDHLKKDKFEKILDGFHKDGTHPDFPIQKVYRGEELARMAGLHMEFDLPALVVYEHSQEGEVLHIGMVFALSHTVDGVNIHVISKYDGKTVAHLIEESPSGKQPAYLLVKKHQIMNSVP